jgi:D-sedoheptulose 7-phosphate isomerase
VEKAAVAVAKAVKGGGKLIVFGNGGSAADSQHIVAELVGRFKKERRAIPAVALTTNTSTLTAIANDYGYDVSFSRQIEALAAKGDVVLAISTSGNAKNVLAAVRKAREMGLVTIGLTGGEGGELAKTADISVIVPSRVTARIQESHIMIGHIICEFAEDAVSGD